MIKDTDKKILDIIGEITGLEPEDINYDDFLREDLHMGLEEFTLLSEKLSTLGIDEDNLDFSQVQTVSDLIELVHSLEEI